jgi:4-hydroxy-2-oxoheptanedioate aldolase
MAANSLPFLSHLDNADTNGATNGNGSAKPADMRAYMAPSLFQPHNARQAIRDAHNRVIPPLLAVYYGVSSVHFARFLAPLGFDAVWIDWEHTSCNVETMTTMVHETMFMSGGKTIPWVRVPGHDHAAIGYALDCGASIVVPQVDTVEQCRHVISAAKYGTSQRGTRSCPPFRLIPGITDAAMLGTNGHESLNNQAAVMIQIETLEGINNLDAMLTECPDVDAVWLGSLDCRISMNLPANFGLGGDEPEWIAAEKKFEETLRKHNKPRGGFGFGESVKRNADKGYSFIVFDADVARLMGLVQSHQEAKEAVKLA